MKTEVLNPVVTVQVRGDRVEVKELSWKDYLRAVKELTSTVMQMIDKNGNITVNKDQIVEALGSQESLVQWLIEKSTGKDSKWVDSLTAREVFPVLEAIIELNLSAEIIAAGKTLAGRMGEAFGSKTASPKPSITSSPTTTASRT